MRTNIRTKLGLGVLLLMVAALLGPAGAAFAAPLAAPITVDLCATTGSITMPDSAVVTVWGYAPGNCTGTPSVSVPGPTIDVNEGDVVTVNLYNNLTEATALLFQDRR